MNRYTTDWRPTNDARREHIHGRLQPMEDDRPSIWQQWSALIAGRWLQLLGMTFLLLAVFTVAGLLAITVAAVSSAWWLH